MLQSLLQVHLALLHGEQSLKHHLQEHSFEPEVFHREQIIHDLAFQVVEEVEIVLTLQHQVPSFDE